MMLFALIASTENAKPNAMENDLHVGDVYIQVRVVITVTAKVGGSASQFLNSNGLEYVADFVAELPRI